MSVLTRKPVFFAESQDHLNGAVEQIGIPFTRKAPFSPSAEVGQQRSRTDKQPQLLSGRHARAVFWRILFWRLLRQNKTNPPRLGRKEAADFTEGDSCSFSAVVEQS